MKKFLTTAFLFTLAAVAFAQGAPVAAQKSLFEGQFVRVSPAIPRPPVPSAPP